MYLTFAGQFLQVLDKKNEGRVLSSRWLHRYYAIVLTFARFIRHDICQGLLNDNADCSIGIVYLGETPSRVFANATPLFARKKLCKVYTLFLKKPFD